MRSLLLLGTIFAYVAQAQSSPELTSNAVIGPKDVCKAASNSCVNKKSQSDMTGCLTGALHEPECYALVTDVFTNNPIPINYYDEIGSKTVEVFVIPKGDWSDSDLLKSQCSRFESIDSIKITIPENSCGFTVATVRIIPNKDDVDLLPMDNAVVENGEVLLNKSHLGDMQDGIAFVPINDCDLFSDSDAQVVITRVWSAKPLSTPIPTPTPKGKSGVTGLLGMSVLGVFAGAFVVAN